MDKTITVQTENLSTTRIVMEGYMFRNKVSNGLYLSGDSYNTVYNDFYSDVRSISANNPPFSGIPVTDFKIIGENRLEFTLPQVPQGSYDIIFCNPAGYSKASNSNKFISIYVNDKNSLSFYSISGNKNIFTINDIQIVTISKYI